LYQNLAYTTLIRPILEFGASCRNSYMKGQIHVFDIVQKKAAKFVYHINESNWKTLSQCRMISRICSIFKAYSGERA
jgi:hypothetical protein